MEPPDEGSALLAGRPAAGAWLPRAAAGCALVLAGLLALAAAAHSADAGLLPQSTKPVPVAKQLSLSETVHKARRKATLVHASLAIPWWQSLVNNMWPDS